MLHAFFGIACIVFSVVGCCFFDRFYGFSIDNVVFWGPRVHYFVLFRVFLICLSNISMLWWRLLFVSFGFWYTMNTPRKEHAA